MMLGAARAWWLPVWLLVSSAALLGFQEMDPEDLDEEARTVEVYLRYGTYSEPRRIFRVQALQNLTRTGYVPRPGNRVRVVRTSNVFSAPFARGPLALGSVPIGVEGDILEVMPYRRRRGLLGSYLGHEVWVLVRFPTASIAEEVLTEDVDWSEDPSEG